MANLTPKQKAQLDELQAGIQLGQITVSFSIEGRDRNGYKKSAFYSTNATRKSSSGWSVEEAQLVSCLLSKHVVLTVYRDAVKRGILLSSIAQAEASAVLARYNASIRNMLQNEEDADES